MPHACSSSIARHIFSAKNFRAEPVELEAKNSPVDIEPVRSRFNIRIFLRFFLSFFFRNVRHFWVIEKANRERERETDARGLIISFIRFREGRAETRAKEPLPRPEPAVSKVLLAVAIHRLIFVASRDRLATYISWNVKAGSLLEARHKFVRGTINTRRSLSWHQWRHVHGQMRSSILRDCVFKRQRRDLFFFSFFFLFSFSFLLNSFCFFFSSRLFSYKLFVFLIKVGISLLDVKRVIIQNAAIR